jgi:hypothetical protein
MSNGFERDLREWLAAEEAGSEAGAEAALTRAFRRAGRLAPSAAFSDRALRAAGFRVGARSVWSPWTRAAALVCLCAAGVALAMLPGMLVALQPLVHGAAWPVVSAAWRLSAGAVGLALAAGAVVDHVAAAIRMSLASSTGAALVLGNVVVAAGSLLGLKRLLRGRQELLEC